MEAVGLGGVDIMWLEIEPQGINISLMLISCRCIYTFLKIKSFHPTLYNGCDYSIMLGSKLIHVSERGPGGKWFSKQLLHKRIDVIWHILPKMSLRDEFLWKSHLCFCSSLISNSRHIQEFAALLLWVIKRSVKDGTCTFFPFRSLYLSWYRTLLYI